MKKTGPQLTRKFYIDTLRRAFSRAVLRRGIIDRNEKHVLKIYDRAYHESDDVALDVVIDKLEYVRRNGCVLNLTRLEHKKELIQNVSVAISRSNVKSMLDLGCGRGFFLMALGVLHPSITVLRGIELSPSGVAYAQKLLADPPIAVLKILTGGGFLSPKSVHVSKAGILKLLKVRFGRFRTKIILLTSYIQIL